VTPEEVAKFVEEKNIQIVDLKFNDLPGLWQHFSMPGRCSALVVWATTLP
jgi:glutamine synthetase